MRSQKKEWQPQGSISLIAKETPVGNPVQAPVDP